MLDLDVTEKMVLDTIVEIQDMKRSAARYPDFATKEEIFNSIKVELLESLRSLYRKGRIEFHRNINGVEMFGIKQIEPHE